MPVVMAIAVNDALCLRSKFTKATCTKCAEVCPSHSIKENLEVDNRCTDCGLCLASCPVEAIGGSSYEVEPIRQLIATESPIRFGCKKTQPESPWPCLGFLDAILLLACVYSGKDANREVTIFHKECATCNSDIARHLARIVEETNYLLGPNKQSIVLTSERDKATGTKAISRRQFFAELWGASVSTVREVAFPVSDRFEPIPRHKLFIASGGEELLPRYVDGQTLFKSIEINDSCNACQLCAKVCNRDAHNNRYYILHTTH